MNRVFLLNFILAVTLSLSACSKDEQPQTKRESPFAEQQKALEKAREVNKLIQDADEKQRQQIEEQGG